MTTIRSRLSAWVAAMRPGHWIKNGFVLLPAFFAGEAHSLAAWLPALAGFAVFCLAASTLYLFNDLIDQPDDRQHARNRTRPLAAGTLSRAEAKMLLAVLLAATAAAAWAFRLPLFFVAILGLYLAAGGLYSLWLKRVAILEVFVLAGFTLLRLYAGSAFTHTPLSGWIIALTALLALLLAFGKRRATLAMASDKEKLRRPIRSYSLAWLDQMMAVTTAGLLAVYLMFCLSDYGAARYGAHLLWSAVFVGAGVARYLWQVNVAGRGDCPTALLWHDRVLAALVAGYGLMFGVLIYG